MARRRSRGKQLERIVEVGVGVALLVGIATYYAFGLSREESFQVAVIGGMLGGAFWAARPLFDWIWRLTAPIRRAGRKAWARQMLGITGALGAALLVGWLVYRFRQFDLESSIRVGIITALCAFGLWLARPLLLQLWGHISRAGQRLVAWVAERISSRQSRAPSRSSTGSVQSDLHRLSPRAFEELCAHLAESWGYKARASGATGDGGVDVEMWRDGEYVVGQCKRYKGTVPISEVRDFYGAMMHVRAVRGYFFTTGRFSEGAYDFVRGKPIELLDGEALERIVERAGAAGWLRKAAL